MQQVFSKHLFKKIKNAIERIYPTQEAEAITYLIMEHVCMLSKTDILINVQFDNIHELELADIIKRVLKDEPIQYILGITSFYGSNYFVDDNVLIPRQETEELIQIIVNENRSENLKLLDIGTGSGCIACALALHMNDADVTGLDLSIGALEIAQSNAKNLTCNVSFLQSDILNDKIPIDNIDIIVSNPPYVTNSEKQLMNHNVLDFEPDLALFVSDKNPLLFYQVITLKAFKHLNNSGKLYFEINEAFGNEVSTLMKNGGFYDIIIHKDLNGKDRFVSGLK